MSLSIGKCTETKSWSKNHFSCVNCYGFTPHPLALARRRFTLHRMKWTCTAAVSIQLTHGLSSLCHSLFFSFIAWYSKAQNLKVTAFLCLKVPALSGSWILHCTQLKQTICFLQILIPLHLFYALKREKLKFKVSLFNAFSKTENRGFSQNFLSFNLYFSLNETVISNFFFQVLY